MQRWEVKYVLNRSISKSLSISFLLHIFIPPIQFSILPPAFMVLWRLSNQHWYAISSVSGTEIYKQCFKLSSLSLDAATSLRRQIGFPRQEEKRMKTSWLARLWCMVLLSGLMPRGQR